MSKTTQVPRENVSREQGTEQMRERIAETIRTARQAEQDAARDIQREGQVIVTVPGIPPIGRPGAQAPPHWNDVIPPQAVDISIAFFIMVAAIIVGYPIMRAIGRRIEGGAPAPQPLPGDVRNQLQHIAQSVDAIAIEVERISEGQRFASKILAERSADPMMTQLGNSARP